MSRFEPDLSHSSTIEMPSHTSSGAMDSKAKDEELAEAMALADEASLRAYVLALSTESDDIRDKICDHLKRIAFHNRAEGNTHSSGVKRKAESPVYICRCCGYAFDPYNDRKSCRYHPDG